MGGLIVEIREFLRKKVTMGKVVIERDIAEDRKLGVSNVVEMV